MINILVDSMYAYLGHLTSLCRLYAQGLLLVLFLFEYLHVLQNSLCILLRMSLLSAMENSHIYTPLLCMNCVNYSDDVFLESACLNALLVNL